MTKPLAPGLSKKPRLPAGTPSNRPKKSGYGATPEGKAKRIAENQQKYIGISQLPVEQLALIGDDFTITDKAKAFIKNWAQGESVTTAAQRAGYADGARYAYALTRIPKVQALYAEEKRLYEEASQMSRKKVMDMLLESFDMAKLMAEPASMVSAAREIGKMCGYYEPVKTQIDVNVNGKVLVKRLDSMSDDELIKMIGNGMAAIQQMTEEEDGEPA